MAPRYLPLLIVSLVLVSLLAGCTGNNQGAAVTPVPTSPPETPATVQTTVLPPPEPFPGALAVGTPFQYGREDISTDVTVTGVRATAEYEWWSP
ncbi:MAG TPA: hypothetical protein VEI51_06395, partial [Methanomicrobiales archaeon]|nr:hypothetical protein [Methanomicrobiales archaeon]